MNGRDIDRAIAGIAVIVFVSLVAFLGAHCLVGCLPAKQAAAERAYKEEQEDCLRQYEAVPERRECVKLVRLKWAADGGAK